MRNPVNRAISHYKMMNFMGLYERKDKKINNVDKFFDLNGRHKYINSNQNASHPKYNERFYTDALYQEIACMDSPKGYAKIAVNSTTIQNLYKYYEKTNQELKKKFQFSFDWTKVAGKKKFIKLLNLNLNSNLCK
ncbi:hypothetical protein A3Q56_08077 [Intoshia linei]|uniref:Uncharacterized protein n=1 Tax=Intoshia linei TaxID=1819745 RepID=A0A177AQ88_9BILA|nr:hypothetical protein A3Q56_08077 [Intoshia linei]